MSKEGEQKRKKKSLIGYSVIKRGGFGCWMMAYGLDGCTYYRMLREEG